MRRDNAADPGLPGLGALGIDPVSVETELRRRMGPALDQAPK
jgi:hypothetical protein